MTPTNPLFDRLQKGAIKLGALWRSSRRCLSRGWSIQPGEYLENPFVMEPCDCEKKTDFCHARLLWLSLAAQNKQEIVPGEHGLALTMSSKQWDVTGLTITLPIKEGLQVKVGPKGSMSMAQFRELSKDPASAAGIFALIKAFPKARIDGIVEPGTVLPGMPTL
jgi:hypothetical protein